MVTVIHSRQRRASRRTMGDVLVGVCLGGERVLRLERAGLEGEEKTADGRVDVLLESGTVYVQRSVQSEVVCPSPQPQIADTPVVLNQWRGPQ
jgi:hypothetical protein